MRTLDPTRYAETAAALVNEDDRAHNAWADHDLSVMERALVALLFGAQHPRTGADRLTEADLAALLGVRYGRRGLLAHQLGSLTRMERITVDAAGILHPVLLPVGEVG